MPEVHVKAVPVNGLVQFVHSQLSSDQVHALSARMGEDARFFTGHLLAHEVVPLKTVNRYTSMAASLKGEELKAFARRAGRYRRQAIEKLRLLDRFSKVRGDARFTRQLSIAWVGQRSEHH